MQKLNSLHAAVTATLHELNIEPSRLLAFIKKGTIVATGTETLSFEYRYHAKIVITHYIGAPDDILIAIVEWVHKNQPDAVTNPAERKKAIKVKSHMHDNDAVDLAITLRLTESVLIGVDEHGVRTIKYIDDSAVAALDG